MGDKPKIIVKASPMQWQYFTADEVIVRTDGSVHVYAYDCEGKPYHDKLTMHGEKVEIEVMIDNEREKNDS